MSKIFFITAYIVNLNMAEKFEFCKLKIIIVDNSF